jgi:hypothetical protein
LSLESSEGFVPILLGPSSHLFGLFKKLGNIVSVLSIFVDDNVHFGLAFFKMKSNTWFSVHSSAFLTPDKLPQESPFQYDEVDRLSLFARSRVSSIPFNSFLAQSSCSFV